jgi:hypothetical protein
MHMNLSRSFARNSLLALIVIALFVNGCGDDDKGNDSNGDELVVLGDFSQDLMAAKAACLDANAAIFASAEYFGPLIVAALASTQSVVAADLIPCLPAEALGRTFEFNGVAYAGVSDPTVSEIGARFLLYEITQGGTPNIAAPLGAIEIHCVGDETGATATIDVVSGSTAVLMLLGGLNSGTFSLSGTMRGPSGTPTMQVGGSQIPNLSGLTIGFSIPEQFHAAYSPYPDSEDGPQVSVEVFGPFPSAEWSMYATIEHDLSGDVSDGYASYNDLDVAGVVACVQTGTIESPVFSAPAVSCAGGEPLLSTSNADREAMHDGYVSLRSLYQTVAGFVELGFVVMAGS